MLVMARNLALWTTRIGPSEGIVTTRSLRRWLFGLAGSADPLGSQRHAPTAGTVAVGAV